VVNEEPLAIVAVVFAVPPDTAANVPPAELETKFTVVVAAAETGFPYASWSCTRMGPIALVEFPWVPDTGAVAITSCEAGPAPMVKSPPVSALVVAVPEQLLEVNALAMTEKLEVEAGVAPFAVCTVNVQVPVELLDIDTQLDALGERVLVALIGSPPTPISTFLVVPEVLFTVILNVATPFGANVAL